MSGFDLGVSVVVPFHGDGLYFNDCLQSISDQRYSKVEVIVIDDASPVAAAPFADPWRDRMDIRTIRLPQNVGTYVARKRGVSQARFPWVTFLDPDDMLLPGALSTMVNTAQESESCVTAIGFQGLYPEQKSAPLGWASDVLLTEPARESLLGLLGQRPNGQSGKLYRTTLCADLFNLWPEEPHLTFAEDFLFNVLAMSKASLVSWSPRRLYGYRQHDASITRSFGIDAAIALSRQVDQIHDTLIGLIPRLDGNGIDPGDLHRLIESRRWRSHLFNFQTRSDLFNENQTKRADSLAQLNKDRPELAGPILALFEQRQSLRDQGARRMQTHQSNNRSIRKTHLTEQRSRFEEKIRGLQAQLQTLRGTQD